MEEELVRNLTKIIKASQRRDQKSMCEGKSFQLIVSVQHKSGYSYNFATKISLSNILPKSITKARNGILFNPILNASLNKNTMLSTSVEKMNYEQKGFSFSILKIQSAKKQIKYNNWRMLYQNALKANNYVNNNMFGIYNPFSQENHNQNIDLLSPNKQEFSGQANQQRKQFSRLKKYQILYQIGQGGFGKVFKIKNISNSKQYALKRLQKAILVTKRQVKSTQNQRNILVKLPISNFITNLYQSFQDRENLYLVLDFASGKDLRHHMTYRNFSQQQIRFIIANIILALQLLHSENVGIVHRDIKPQNLLFMSNGYLKLCDFGISQQVEKINRKQIRYDCSGTPSYMAPQILTRKDQGYYCDYYSVGIICYELIFGERPYKNSKRKELKQQIFTKKINIAMQKISDKFDDDINDFLNKLLQRNPEKRLGYHGISEIKDHPWLKKVDWQHIKTLKMQAPFIPEQMYCQTSDEQTQQISINYQENLRQTQLILRKKQINQDLFKGYQFQRTLSEI